MQLVPTRLEGPVLLAPNAHVDELCFEMAEIADSLPL